MSWYIDSSAILKLILDESERKFLVKFLKSPSVTSRVSRVEVKRTVNRLAPEHLELAFSELEKLDYFPISTSILNVAESFDQSITLRTLDAIQVATALYLGESIEGLISYDAQMLKNAKKLGLKVISPGMK
ncbi:MAG: type II toxin-antitoxin system VapC family toxin [Actinobacteria bacterium]|nr:type II toxin-antitoxin system VapC family toxin [Actinomycetota bacterium]